MRLRAAALAAASFAFALGCDRPPSPSAAREWTPDDHDRLEESQNAASGAQAAPRKKSGAQDETASLVDTAWQMQCATCHGPMGRGDGPNGPMVNAPDLTRASFQEQTTDAQIAEIIRNGKGKMPKLDLPDAVVAGLVARVRLVGGRAPSPSVASAPSASAAAPTGSSARPKPSP